MPLAVVESGTKGGHRVPRQSKHQLSYEACSGHMRRSGVSRRSETRKIDSDSDQQPRRWFLGVKCLLDWWLSYLPHFLPLPTLSTLLVIGCSGLSDRVIFTTITNSTTGTRHDYSSVITLTSCISTLSVTLAFGPPHTAD
jgi:hypothetical protein